MNSWIRVVVAVTGSIASQMVTAQVVASPPPQVTKADLALVEQCGVLERRLERRGLIYHDTALRTYLTTVARDLVPDVKREYLHWRFLVLREPLVTAFSQPDGTIYLGTGLLAALENEDQLAGVLAHEIAHVLNGDAFLAAREYRKKETARSIGKLAALAAPLAGSGLGAGAGAAAFYWSDRATYLILANTEQPLALAATLGYSDEAERKADQAAITNLSHAGRDPTQIAQGIERMGRVLDAEPMSTLYTDPTKVRGRLAGLRKGDEASPNPVLYSRQYAAAVGKAIRDNIALDINVLRFRTAVDRAERLAAGQPEDAENTYWRAEAYRSLGPRTVDPSPEERSIDSGEALRKHTAEEQYRRLVATPAGLSAQKANEAKAEELFQIAVHSDARFAPPHLGLGMLYASQGRIDEARSRYREYLELAPNAPDRARVENRLADLDRHPKR